MERFSELEKAELWDRYEAGESLRSIGRCLGRAPSSIRTHLVAAGWKRPVPAGDWCPLRLSFGEREEISRGLATGESFRCIARRLGRSPSTMSREVASNGGRRRYRAVLGHRTSRRRAHRPKPSKLAEHQELRARVEEKLGLWWSPLQISRWLESAYPDTEEMRVSHDNVVDPHQTLHSFVVHTPALSAQLDDDPRRPVGAVGVVPDLFDLLDQPPFRIRIDQDWRASVRHDGPSHPRHSSPGAQ